MIPVTKTYLPPFEEYKKQLMRAWEKGWITNNGILVTELEAKLKEYLGVDHLLFCSNGTIVLQMALKVFNITKEVITTPFSYVATTNAVLWEQCEPVFVDIDKNDFCIDTKKIEAAITENTEAILATHVYGSPCNIDAIQKLALRYSLKVIYDGAHCFGTVYNNRQLLSYGDISTCSFHATKLFHTVEGGCIITKDAAIAEKLYLLRSFGHIADEYYSIGINGKNSEFHAAMGLANLPHLPCIIEKRKEVCKLYDQLLAALNLQYQKSLPGTEYNYAYYPVAFNNEATLKNVINALKAGGVEPRRYFYPSLNKLPFLNKSFPCPVSEEISSRVLCLPLYERLSLEEVKMICKIIESALR
jgi:dTDP-4-amino-4,6-dideoxygalactose transaminase